MSYVVSVSGARSGSSTGSEAPRSPPQPPSPRTKIDDRVVHSAAPESDLATPSCQITAALPLSHTSVSVVRTVAEPAVGRGACNVIVCEPCTTWDRSMSQPGRSSDGALGHVEGGRDHAERRQHLQPRPVRGPAQGGRVHVVARS